VNIIEIASEPRFGADYGESKVVPIHTIRRPASNLRGSTGEKSCGSSLVVAGSLSWSGMP
jgi:hypothetical protein